MKPISLVARITVAGLITWGAMHLLVAQENALVERIGTALQHLIR